MAVAMVACAAFNAAAAQGTTVVSSIASGSVVASMQPNAAAPAASPNCSRHSAMAVVAHQDDGLLFMNPDLYKDIAAGGCLRMVYLTAGERGEGEAYMLGREQGVRAAFAFLARQPNDWVEDAVVVNAHHIARFTLKGNPRVQLWHFRLKDPWLGKGWGSLTPLSRAELQPGAQVQALGSYGDVYTRADLVTTLAQLIRRLQPTIIRHQDHTVTIPYTQLCWRCKGHDHPDHIAGAKLVREAMLAAPGPYVEVAYVDYPTQERPANLPSDAIRLKTEAFQIYARHDYHYCQPDKVCREPAGPAAAWVQRVYTVDPGLVSGGIPGVFSPVSAAAK